MIESRNSTQKGWSAFESRLRSYVRRRVEPSSVDDLVGDVLLRLVQHRGEMAAATNPSAWMLRVASNAIVDHHRRRSAERRALSRVESEPTLRGDDTSESSRASEFSNCLVPMIRSLPPAYAEALLLTDVEGLTQTEAAKRLGISVSGMKSRVQRGREKLKAALLHCCEIQVDARGQVLDYRRRSDRCSD